MVPLLYPLRKAVACPAAIGVANPPRTSLEQLRGATLFASAQRYEFVTPGKINTLRQGDAILDKQTRPLAKKLGGLAGTQFQRTFSSLLTANGEDIKVVQELMCRANRIPLCFSILRQAPKTCGARKAKVREMLRRAPIPVKPGTPEQAPSVSGA